MLTSFAMRSCIILIAQLTQASLQVQWQANIHIRVMFSACLVQTAVGSFHAKLDFGSGFHPVLLRRLPASCHRRPRSHASSLNVFPASLRYVHLAQPL